MVDTWTNTYTYQPQNVPDCLMDTVCKAIFYYCKKYGKSHNIVIIAVPNNTDYMRHNIPITVMEYYVKHGNELTRIEDIATEILAYYESYMQDEASNFGKTGYFSEPWSNEDIEIFVRENMIEYW